MAKFAISLVQGFGPDKVEVSMASVVASDVQEAVSEAIAEYNLDLSKITRCEVSKTGDGD